MSVRKLTIITCDGFGCDYRVEIEDTANGDYHGIQYFTLSFSSFPDPKPLWQGSLCKVCEQKMRQQLTGGTPIALT